MKTITAAELTTEIARAGCFVTGMSNEAYHAYEGISKSGLDTVNRSPAHYRYGAKREPSRAMEIGTAIHAALLEPDRFKMEYVLLKDVKDRRASEYKAAVKVHGSERVLVASEADNVSGMYESVLAQPAAQDVLAPGGFRELSAFIEDPDTGILIRCRYDLLTAFGVSVDVKKTRDSSPGEFGKAVYNYRYHVQAAMYSHIHMLITGEPLLFKFLAVEEQPPHCAMVYDLDEESLQIGHIEFKRNLQTYADCLASGDWPGYPDPVQTIGLPSWAINNFENELEIQL